VTFAQMTIDLGAWRLNMSSNVRRVLDVLSTLLYCRSYEDKRFILIGQKPLEQIPWHLLVNL